MSAKTASSQRESIIREIKRLRRSKTPLNYRSIRQSHEPLLRRARETFGTWQAAIEAAGLDYENIRRIRRWTEDSIIAELQALDADAAFASISDLRDKEPKLYDACCRHFGGGLAALEAAGIDYEQLLAQRSERPDRWTKQGVVNHIRERYAEGKTLCRSAILRKEPAEKRFCFAATYLFGNWTKALKAARLDPVTIRNRDGRWPRTKVLEEIRARHEQGKPLNTDAMLRQALPLHAAGRRHFGTWERAVRAAGVNYNQQVRGGLRGWTKPKVHRALQQRIHKNHATREEVRSESPALFRAAVHHYGSWNNAIDAARKSPRKAKSRV